MTRSYYSYNYWISRKNTKLVQFSLYRLYVYVNRPKTYMKQVISYWSTMSSYRRVGLPTLTAGRSWLIS